MIVLCAVAATVARAEISKSEVEQNQKSRIQILDSLKNEVTYGFEYSTIYLDRGSLAGIGFRFPVIHVRYDSDILFDFDKDKLTLASYRVLNDLAIALKKDNNLKSIIMVGHTDAIGPDSYNQDLSRRRALAALNALSDTGIDKAILGVVPMGEAAPVATNTTSEGRAFNRRVEFFISDLAEASVKAIEQSKYDPCYRNDHELSAGGKCDRTPLRIPILWGKEGGPDVKRRYIELGSSSRPALPANWPTRRRLLIPSPSNEQGEAPDAP